MRALGGGNRLWLAVDADDFSCLASYIVNHVHCDTLPHKCHEKRVVGGEGK